MLFNIPLPLVISSKATLTDDMSRGLEIPREHTTWCNLPLSWFWYKIYASVRREGVPEPLCILWVD